MFLFNFMVLWIPHCFSFWQMELMDFCNQAVLLSISDITIKQMVSACVSLKVPEAESVLRQTHLILLYT